MLYAPCVIQESRPIRGTPILLTITGSHAGGFATPTSDLDIRGVFIPSRRDLLGLGTLDHQKIMSDTVLYSLKRFCQLALKSNPELLIMLYSTEHLFVHPFYGDALLSRRDLFLSKKIAKSFGGYARSRISKLHFHTAHGKRKEEVDRLNYDPKDAMHLIRIFRMGVEALRTGHIQVKRPDAVELLAIRRGEVLLSDIHYMAIMLERELENALETTTLPDIPQSEAIEDMLIDLTRTVLMEEENDDEDSDQGD